MVLFEQYAAALLTMHAIFALMTVALSTHLVFWLRKTLRGQSGKRRSLVRFAWLSAAAYGITILLGLALYPTYRVRVRAEYLDNPSRLRQEAKLELQARREARESESRSRQFREGRQDTLLAQNGATQSAAESDASELSSLSNAKIQRAEKLTRWFDVKEHWAFLGLVLALASCGILAAWQPGKGSRGIEKPVMGMVLAAAALAWAAALIGLSTAAAHSVIAL